MKKILTVSIAAYNVEKYLAECLDCFIDDSVLERCEVIIVDDGSKDNTAEIANEYASRYPNTFKLLQKQNGGWGSTLNASIMIAEGKYYKQLDGDDYFYKTDLPEYLDILEKSNADIVAVSYMTFEDSTGEIISKTKVPEDVPKCKLLNIENVIKSIKIEMYPYALKADMLKKNNIHITEHCFYTDIEYIIKALSCAKTIEFADVYCYMYRVARSGQSVSIEGYKKHYKEHLTVLKNMLEYVEARKEIFYKELFRTRLKDMIVRQYSIFFTLQPNNEHKKELKEFDEMLKMKYQLYYKTNSEIVRLMRLTRFALYKPAVKYILKKNSK